MSIIFKDGAPHVLRLVEIKHLDKDGKVIWEDREQLNILHNEGELELLTCFFASSYPGYEGHPSYLYLGLDNRPFLNLEDTLSTIYNGGSSYEPTTIGGYMRKPLSTGGNGLPGQGQDFEISQATTYYKVTSKPITWIADSNWNIPITNVFLCTASTGISGKLISTVRLKSQRTILIGEQLQISIAIGINEA